MLACLLRARLLIIGCVTVAIANPESRFLVRVVTREDRDRDRYRDYTGKGLGDDAGGL